MDNYNISQNITSANFQKSIFINCYAKSTYDSILHTSNITINFLYTFLFNIWIIYALIIIIDYLFEYKRY